MRIKWGKLSKNVELNCDACLKKATHWFIFDSLLKFQELRYCEECLKVRLNKLDVPM